MTSKSDDDGSISVYAPQSKASKKKINKNKRKFVGDVGSGTSDSQTSNTNGAKNQRDVMRAQIFHQNQQMAQHAPTVQRPPAITAAELFQKPLSVSLSDIHALRAGLAKENPKAAFETAMQWIRESNRTFYLMIGLFLSDGSEMIVTAFTLESLDAIIQPMRAHEVMSAIMTLLLDSLVAEPILMRDFIKVKLMIGTALACTDHTT